MSQPISMPTPPVFPLTPQVPPMNTATGILNDLGTPTPAITFSNLGEYFHPDITDQRYELYDIITLKTTSEVGEEIYSKFGIPLGTGSDYQPMVPARAIKFMSCMYADLEVEFLFLAVKPPDTTGRIMIRYHPEYNDLGAFQPLDDSTRVLWDLGASPTCSFKFQPFCPINHRPTHLLEGMALDLKYRCKVSLEVDTPYLPGSIYPDSINIYVFSRVGMTTYMPVKPCRNDLNT